MALVLTSCGPGVPVREPMSDGARRTMIACAIQGERLFKSDCAVVLKGRSITLHHADGGFRRLLLADREIKSADGSDTVRINALRDGRRELEVDGDRYVLPPE